jgi:peroxiredoxin
MQTSLVSRSGRYKERLLTAVNSQHLRNSAIIATAGVLLSILEGSAVFSFNHAQNTDKNYKTKKSINASKVEGSELIGKEAPEFVGLKWLDGKHHTLKEYRGHPVLIRFWNRNCSMCAESAPTLTDLKDQFGEKGLVVIGIHHRKTSAPDSLTSVRATAQAWKMNFPIAIDNDWQTLNKMWMNKKRIMTSVTLLIDKEGKIIWLHPGGTLRRGSSETVQLDKIISQQLQKNT